MSKKILLIGGGGHCKSVLDSLLELKEYSEIGVVDKIENVGKSVMGVPVVGCDDDLTNLYRAGFRYAFVTVGSIGDPILRIKLYNLLCEIGYDIPIIIDKSAKVSVHTVIEQGVFIGKQTVINTGALIKKGAIINSGAIVEHDCQIGIFSHIAPGVVLGGEVFVGENSHVGLNSTVKQGIHIGTHSIIGMGSVVLKNIDNYMMAYGNPCREVKKI
ncbi:acetyltransferase [Helicovermis profundi]|uniref:Acetyltransferase n=1 Tax=Helicovermis profundi TaxID=3065157 RepID=A0AAU9EFQ7_9FIRM|nr:acetyltransferase [Clostridia bacterium S502]